jgi:hypothetical protein
MSNERSAHSQTQLILGLETTAQFNVWAESSKLAADRFQF